MKLEVKLKLDDLGGAMSRVGGGFFWDGCLLDGRFFFLFLSVFLFPSERVDTNLIFISSEAAARAAWA